MADESKPEGEVFDIDRLRHLVELMQEHDLSEVDLRNEDRRIRLRRGTQPVVTMPAATAPVAPATSANPPAGAASADPAPAADDKATYIKSPMVGTFYSSPKPDTPAFIKVGDHVEADTIVCLVEAMKMFNEIPAGVAGRIESVLAKNEDPVDVGKPLFKVIPD
jgi:acetyl-CoA carboxylase biotin carboxyl carrier protein